MRRFLLPLLVLGLGIAGAQSIAVSPYDDFTDKLIAFDKPYLAFIRAYIGCPPSGPMNTSTCDPDAGEINRRAYREAREAAKKLFDLIDPSGKDGRVTVQ